VANHDPIEFFNHPVPDSLRDDVHVEVEQDIVAPAPKPKRAGKASADGYQPFNW